MTGSLPEDALREFLHELRTPLTALAVSVSLLEDSSVAGSMSVALAHMRELIAAEMDRSVAAGAAGRCDVASVALEAVEVASMGASGGGGAAAAGSAGVGPVLARLLRADEGLCAAVPAVALRRTVLNLVANAVRFSPPGECVDVSVYASDGLGVVEVRDFGPGVPEDALASLGVSPVESLSGYGVGLFLARSFALRSGGALEFSLARPGLRACLSLPLL